jgi:hypothetical protein
MKLPKYFVQTMREAIDVGINAFAIQLLAESFADDPDKFKDENVVFLAHAHNGHEVWFVMSKTPFTRSDFEEPAPAGPTPADTQPAPCVPEKD